MSRTKSDSANPFDYESSHNEANVYRACLKDKVASKGKENNDGNQIDIGSPAPIQVNTTYAMTTPLLEEPITEFTIFPKLVLELRRMVFRAALPPPSVVQVETDPYTLDNNKTFQIQFVPSMSLGKGAPYTGSRVLAARGIHVRGVNTEAKEVYESALPFCLPVYFEGPTDTGSVFRFGPEDLLFIQYTLYAMDNKLIYNALATQAWRSKITKIAFEKFTVHKVRYNEPSPQDKSKDFTMGYLGVFELFPNLEEIKLMNKDWTCQEHEGFDRVPEHLKIKRSLTLAKEEAALNKFASAFKQFPYVIENKLNVPRFSYA